MIAKWVGILFGLFLILGGSIWFETAVHRLPVKRDAEPFQELKPAKPEISSASSTDIITTLFPQIANPPQPKAGEPKPAVSPIAEPTPPKFESPKIVIPPKLEKFAAPAVLPPPAAALSSEAVYQMLDTAVVQVVCGLGNNLYSTGTGIVVSERGVVLTNAHVVNRGTNCAVRTGNPAKFAGTLKVLFVGGELPKIPDTEIAAEDLALGLIERSENSAFRTPFKYLKLDSGYRPTTGDGYYAAAYASEFLGDAVLTSGAQNLVFTTARLLGAYGIDADSSAEEIIELSGNVSTQQGSSGSPILSPKDGAVVAVVFGENKEAEAGTPNTSKRTEFAFLVSYLDRLVRQKQGISLAAFAAQLGL